MKLNTILVSLRTHLQLLLDTDYLGSIKNKAYLANQWFTEDSINYCLQQWIISLNDNEINKWTKNISPTKNPKKIGLIMAGNIPMVGLHDLICVILSGHQAVVKLSSNDEILMKYAIKNLNKNNINPIVIEERVKNIDAVIATGSNNSMRYFEYYFGKVPHIFRNNRTSIAVLTGTETNEELKELGKDVFTYFGLGCRNVTKLLVPKDYDFPHLLDQWQHYITLIDHNKFANNYTYHKALYLMNIEKHFDTGYALLRESKKLSSGVSNLLYSFYKSEKDIQKFIIKEADNLQCIIGKGTNMLPFGQSQKPKLNNYADGINTIEFLECL